MENILGFNLRDEQTQHKQLKKGVNMRSKDVTQTQQCTNKGTGVAYGHSHLA